MRDSRHANLIITVSLLMICGAFAVYATLVMRWFTTNPGVMDSARVEERAALAAALEQARRDFRAHLLDPRAHLRLSEALWRAGRPVDSFYVMYAARQLFAEGEFRRAHAEIVVGVGQAAAAVRAGLKGATDPELIVSLHAATAREYPDSPEGRDSLDKLSQLAESGGNVAQSARAALEELYKQDPKNPDKLAALGKVVLGQGNTALAAALANEAFNKSPGHAGAARIMGMLALKDHDVDAARRWLNSAWEKNHNDLYSAAKLAQIYDKRRGDPEAAVPFYLALYRQNPYYSDGEPIETRIREILDSRRRRLLNRRSCR